MQEGFPSRNSVEINVEESFKCLLTVDCLVHCGKVDRIALHDHILLGQDFTVSLHNIACVLLEQADQPQVEFLVSLDCICGVLNCLDQMALLDVHGLHFEAKFFLLKLIVHHFLQIHSFEAQESCQGVVMSLVPENMEAV